MGQRATALKLLEQSAAVLGLDPEAIHEVIEERLGATRNAEGHCIGGVAPCEACRTIRHMEHAASVPAELNSYGLSAQEAPMITSAISRKSRRNLTGGSALHPGDA